MSKLLYQANPSVWRMHPFGTLLAWLVVLAGIYVAATGKIPYVSPLLDNLDLPVWANVRYIGYLGYALILFGVFRLIGWWFTARFDQLEIRENELIWTHGFLNKNYTETNMSSIRTVRVHQSLFQRMVNAGDLVIYTTGDMPELAIKGLPRPNEIREHIKRQSAGEA